MQSFTSADPVYYESLIVDTLRMYFAAWLLKMRTITMIGPLCWSTAQIMMHWTQQD